MLLTPPYGKDSTDAAQPPASVGANVLQMGRLVMCVHKGAVSVVQSARVAVNEICEFMYAHPAFAAGALRPVIPLLAYKGHSDDESEDDTGCYGGSHRPPLRAGGRRDGGWRDHHHDGGDGYGYPSTRESRFRGETYIAPFRNERGADDDFGRRNRYDDHGSEAARFDVGRGRGFRGRQWLRGRGGFSTHSAAPGYFH